MKKTIICTAIIAAFAMVLMTGSALAAQISGSVGFNGSGAALYSDNNDRSTLYGVNLVPDYPNLFPDSLAKLSDVRTNGDFADYLPPAGVGTGWGMPPQMVPDFPAGGGLLFKDEATNAILANLTVGPYAGTEVFFGAIITDLAGTAEFTFTVTDIIASSFYMDLSPDQKSGIGGFRMNGFVDHDDFEKTAATYSFTFTFENVQDTYCFDKQDGNPCTPGLYDLWGYSLDIQARPGADVPEPGTLVLFGTGLLGAAIVARRKMKK